MLPACLKKLAFLVFLGASSASSAMAGSAPQSAFIPEHGPVLAPFAHVVFCQKNPRECVRKGRGKAIGLTSETIDLLNTVNQRVNRQIVPRDDPPGKETWNVNPQYGDCKDYAITKRKMLVDAGLPSAATRLAVAVTPEGIGHVVVIERTTGGDLVLDNRTDIIKLWNDVDLRWLKIQSADNPRLWKDIAMNKQAGG